MATGYVTASILLSGFYIRINQISIGFLRALSWATYTKYALSGVARLELAGVVWPDVQCSAQPATRGTSSLRAISFRGAPKSCSPHGCSVSIASSGNEAGRQFIGAACRSHGIRGNGSRSFEERLFCECIPLMAVGCCAGSTSAGTCFESGDTVLQYWGYGIPVYINALALVGFLILMHAISFAALSKLQTSA